LFINTISAGVSIEINSTYVAAAKEGEDVIIEGRYGAVCSCVAERMFDWLCSVIKHGRTLGFTQVTLKVCMCACVHVCMCMCACVPNISTTHAHVITGSQGWAGACLGAPHKGAVKIEESLSFIVLFPFLLLCATQTHTHTWIC
jgi:hypothetical protein